MEQELGLGAKAKSPFSGNHFIGKETLAQEPSRFLSLLGRKSVGLRKEISHEFEAEEALTIYQFQVASAGAPEMLASEVLLSAARVLPLGGWFLSEGLSEPCLGQPTPLTHPWAGIQSLNCSSYSLLQTLPTLPQGQPGVPWSSGVIRKHLAEKLWG